MRIQPAGQSYQLDLTGDSGASFPAHPSDGQLFYRTDRRIIYEYNNSASLWLSIERHYQSVGSYQSAISVSGTSAGKGTVGEDIYIEKWLATTQVGGTNNSSNKWTLTLYKQSPAEVSTSITSFDTGSDGSSATPHSVSINASLASASFPILLVWATNTGAPGNLELCSTVVVCRSVG